MLCFNRVAKITLCNGKTNGAENKFPRYFAGLNLNKLAGVFRIQEPMRFCYCSRLS